MTFWEEWQRMRPVDETAPRAAAFSLLPHRSRDLVLDGLLQGDLDNANFAWRDHLYEKRALKWEAQALEEEERKEREESPPAPLFQTPSSPFTCSCGVRAGYLIRGRWVCFNHIMGAYEELKVLDALRAKYDDQRPWHLRGDSP